MKLSTRWLWLLEMLAWLGIFVETVPPPEPPPRLLPAPPQRASMPTGPLLPEFNTMNDIAAAGLLLGLPLRMGQA